VIIAQIKALNPHTQLIALSATIKNAVELADWLAGKLIQSDWRPVILKEGVFFQNTIKYNDSSTKRVEGDAKKALELLVQESLRDGGQTLIFVNNRKSTVSLANRLSDIVGDLLTEGEKKHEKVSQFSNEQTEVRY
jgi:helicase